MNLRTAPFRTERGTALIIVMALLAIMCVFVVSATQSLYLVKRELKLIEQKQLQRAGKTPAAASARP